MTSLEHIQRLIEELGPATEEVVEVHQQEEGSWDVSYADETRVGLDHMADQDKLMLTTELGPLPEDRKAHSHEFLLIYNYAWTQSGGIKMGLEAPGGNVVMMFELNASSLDLQTLQGILASFVEKAGCWRELVAAGFDQEETAVEHEHLGFPGAIRV